MIRLSLTFVLLYASLVFPPDKSVAEEILRGSADEFDAIKILPPDDKSDKERIVYGDNRGIIHILKRQKRGYLEEWKSRELGGAIGEVFVEDMDLDGQLEIVVYTNTGRIYFWDPRTNRLIWQSIQTKFESITCMEIYNVDDDDQKEFIFIADSHLYIYDGKDHFEEWRSDEEYTAEDMVIADFDADGQDEIVLNTGFVLDARFRDFEWRYREPFGDRLGMLDIDDDGILELIGESAGRFLRIFDLDLKREKLLD